MFLRSTHLVSQNRLTLLFLHFTFFFHSTHFVWLLGGMNLYVYVSKPGPKRNPSSSSSTPHNIVDPAVFLQCVYQQMERDHIGPFAPSFIGLRSLFSLLFFLFFDLLNLYDDLLIFSFD